MAATRLEIWNYDSDSQHSFCSVYRLVAPPAKSLCHPNRRALSILAIFSNKTLALHRFEKHWTSLRIAEVKHYVWPDL